MQTNQPLRQRIALVFTSRRGGLFYWAGSVREGNWPKRLQYRTSVLVNSHKVVIDLRAAGALNAFAQQFNRHAK
jgi:hypothetical protein